MLALSRVREFSALRWIHAGTRAPWGAIAWIALTGPVFGTIPSPPNSSVSLFVDENNPCVTADIVWNIGSGHHDNELVLAVTVRDTLSSPVPACSLRLDYGGNFSPHSELDTSVYDYAGYLCGTGTDVAVTDGAGAAEFRISYGGGCGTVEFVATVTATCVNPEVLLATVTDTFCVRSTDINGDGTVNYIDVFDYLPQLWVASGFCADLNCNVGMTINLFDTFRLNEDLYAGANCERISLLSADLPACNGPLNKMAVPSKQGSFAGKVGLDRTGDLDCNDPEDMGTNSAFVGMNDTVNVVFTDVPISWSVGCVFCVQDSNTIDPASVQFEINTENPCCDIPFREAVRSAEIDPAILTAYPEAKCWIASSTDFSRTRPGTILNLGRFTYTSAVNGCIGFVIDGSHTAILDTFQVRHFFDGPGATCEPVFCADPTEVEVNDRPPQTRRLLAVQPNPFNPSTTIRFELSAPAVVDLSVRDVSGRLVRKLFRGGRAAGEHQEVWSGLTDDDRVARSGVYFVRLEGPGWVETRKVTLVR